MKGILPILQSQGWNNGTHGGHQLGSGDLGLLLLTIWPTLVSLATVGIMTAHEVYQTVVFATSHPTPPPIPSTPSIIDTDSINGLQKYNQIQPSEINKVSYNKSQ